jgi:excisionase family DNA binding protein
MILEVQANDMNELELLSIEESARSLSVSPWTLRAHIKNGKIAIVRCGRRVLISRLEIARIAREGLPALSKGKK